MDLGLKARKAIVCAASKGLGRACAMSLAREGVELVITARTAADLERTADEIRRRPGEGDRGRRSTSPPRPAGPRRSPLARRRTSW